MGQGKTVLILGGGIGGIVAASRLRKGLSCEHRVVLIEREEQAKLTQSTYLHHREECTGSKKTASVDGATPESE